MTRVEFTYASAAPNASLGVGVGLCTTCQLPSRRSKMNTRPALPGVAGAPMASWSWLAATANPKRSPVSGAAVVASATSDAAA